MDGIRFLFVFSVQFSSLIYQFIFSILCFNILVNQERWVHNEKMDYI